MSDLACAGGKWLKIAPENIMSSLEEKEPVCCQCKETWKQINERLMRQVISEEYLRCCQSSQKFGVIIKLGW